MIDYEDVQFEDRMSADTNDYQDHGWPGDGSGTDDFADFNQNEADDYRDEGAEDSYLDSAYEDDTDIGVDY
jgi:hypothetical protein